MHTIAERGAAYIAIVNPAHKMPTKVILTPPFKPTRVATTTAPRNATFTAATNFNDFIYTINTNLINNIS